MVGEKIGAFAQVNRIHVFVVTFDRRKKIVNKVHTGEVLSSHRIASHRIASHRIASHRIASHRSQQIFVVSKHGVQYEIERCDGVT